MMEIRKSNAVVSGISAQQIAKTMDRNAAEVVKRVPGVTIMEDKFIMVRGLNDRYNSVWLNDVGAPSSEVDKKAFSFDMIPSGQIDRIMVSYGGDDGIEWFGGTVNAKYLVSHRMVDDDFDNDCGFSLSLIHI